MGKVPPSLSTRLRERERDAFALAAIDMGMGTSVLLRHIAVEWLKREQYLLPVRAPAPSAKDKA